MQSFFTCIFQVDMERVCVEKLGSWTAQKIPNLSNILMECMYLKCAQPYCLLKTELINFQHSCMEPWDEMN